jgi:WD40 repeat protein
VHLGTVTGGRLAWSPDGHRMALIATSGRSNNGSVAATVLVWGAGEQPERILTEDPRASFLNGLGLALAWSPDGKSIVSGGNKFRVWDVATGEERCQLLGHEGSVRGLSWADGARIITRAVTKDRLDVRAELKVWDAATGDEILHVGGPAAMLEFTPTLTAFYLNARLWDVTPLRDDVGKR